MRYMYTMNRIYCGHGIPDTYDHNCERSEAEAPVCRRHLREVEQAHSHVMGSENSALAPKILIFRKNGTDEKGLIFGCRIHI